MIKTSPPNRPKWCQGVLRKRFWKPVGGRNAKRDDHLWEKVLFWRCLVDLGCHFGASWIPKRSQHHSFRFEISKKCEKWFSKTMPKKTWNLAWILMPKWEARIGDYRAPVRCLLRFKRFRRSRDFHENGCQNGSQNKWKIEPWAPQGRYFEISGCLLERSFFHEFSMGKKCTKNQKKNDLGAPMVKKTVIFGLPPPGRTPGRKSAACGVRLLRRNHLLFHLCRCRFVILVLGFIVSSCHLFPFVPFPSIFLAVV